MYGDGAKIVGRIISFVVLVVVLLAVANYLGLNGW